MNVEIIAELEINHGASLDIAKQLVFAAAKVGANTVKFQAFNAEEFTAPDSPYRAIISNLQLDPQQFDELKHIAEQCDVNFLLTIADLSSVKAIEALGLKRIKVGSTNLTNHVLLREIAKTKAEIILSTGASTLSEIHEAVHVIRSYSDQDLSLMHCTVAYPCSDNDLNLLSLKALQREFTDLPIGFSDHSKGSTASVIATALGATLIEKHFTLSEHMEGPDHHFCMNPSDFKKFVDSIRTTEAMLGTLDKKPLPVEDGPRLVGRRYFTYASNYSAGTELDESSFLIQRQPLENVQDCQALIPTLANASFITSNCLQCSVQKYQIVEREHFSH